MRFEFTLALPAASRAATRNLTVSRSSRVNLLARAIDVLARSDAEGAAERPHLSGGLWLGMPSATWERSAARRTKVPVTRGV
jgi:hypothetical protein